MAKNKKNKIDKQEWKNLDKPATSHLEFKTQSVERSGPNGLELLVFNNYDQGVLVQHIKAEKENESGFKTRVKSQRCNKCKKGLEFTEGTPYGH